MQLKKAVNHIDNQLIGNYSKSFSFLLCSIFALSCDLCVFQLGVFLGFPVVPVNITSSAIAITANYCLLSKFTFNQRLNTQLFFIFFLYYSSSIVIFSLAISHMVIKSTWPALLCKILLLPVSFLVNFFFSHLILGKRRHEQ